MSRISTEGRLLAVNKKFLAFSYKNNGEIIIVDSSKPSKINDNQLCIRINKEIIKDIEFSPFDNNILSTCANNLVYLWKIPENGLDEDLVKESLIFKEHNKKVNFVNFNPICKDVLCSGGFSNEILVWNGIKAENYVMLNAIDKPTAISWNPNGALIGAIARNKFMNIFEPRINKMTSNFQISNSNSSSKFDWIDNNSFITISREKLGIKK